LTPTAAPVASETPEAAQHPPLFQPVKTSPIIEHSADDWDALYTDPGAVLVVGNQIVMFRNGTRDANWPGAYDMAITTSADGAEWITGPNNPVWKDQDIPYQHVAALVTGAVQQP